MHQSAYSPNAPVANMMANGQEDEAQQQYYKRPTRGTRAGRILKEHL